MHFRASHRAGYNMAAQEAIIHQFPAPLDRGVISARAILEQRLIHIADATEDSEIWPLLTANGARSYAAIPLMRDGKAVGAISMNTSVAGGFSKSQIVLLKTFAHQAVIAISSAETYRALQTRTSDLQESLEYQTATSDVLRVISRSTFALQPVLDTVVETAARLCEADQAVLSRREGELVSLAANYGFSPEYEAAVKARGAFLVDPHSPLAALRAMIERRSVHICDVTAVPGYPKIPIRLGKERTTLGVPLLRDGEAIGVILLVRQRVEPFTDRQIALVSTFADQAVIAIENTRLITEQREALERQTATAEVLQVINASPANLAPVFEAMLDKALGLCEAAFGVLWTYDGTQGHAVALRGVPPAFAEYLTRAPHPVDPGGALGRLLSGEPLVHIADAAEEQAYRSGNPLRRALVELGRARTMLAVPLRKDNVYLGHFVIYRREVRPFSDKQIALLRNFAAQAVIAMENARLLTEQQEALEQQTATAEVLQVINTSPGNLAPVFDTILEKAHILCGAGVGALFTYDGTYFHAVATRGSPEQHARMIRKPFRPTPHHQPLVSGERYVHFPDVKAIARQQDEDVVRSTIERTDMRAGLAVPLRKDGTLLGYISAFRQEVRLFSEKEIALLENFAAQAVVAMENARLLDEIRQRQEELRITFENMGDGVAMFDGTQHLVAWNRKFQDILDVPDDIIARRQTFSEYVHYLAERGEYGPGADPEGHVRGLIEQTGQSRTYERTRPDGRVIEIRHNPVPGGGFVLIYADITERKRNEAEIRSARDAAETALRELKAAQANLIQAEKMASLGQLTAGIAHEIKNPLNFVNNFSALSIELIDELRGVLAPEPLGETARPEIDDLTALLKGNLEKVVQHGQRADGIVRSMLEHSRGSSAERHLVGLNALIDEALNLAYHGARARDQTFNITVERDFDEGVPPIEVNPQDMTRVFLNIFSNGFDATTRRASNGGKAGFVPMLEITTRDAGEAVEIRVRDNGTGIPSDIRDKLFQPFFTTKPTGEGTGLGLSITYDIVTKQHGGSIAVDSVVGEYSEFTIRLPRHP
jgi:signal transduction histidine kinase